MSETPIDSFRRLLTEYRQAMQLRWVHESQDKAAHNLAALVSNLARRSLLQVLPRPAPSRPEGGTP